MSYDKNEFYLNLSKEIMDINYDVFNNFIPTNYQDNYINYIEDYSGKYANDYEKDITNNLYKFIKPGFNPNRSQKFVNNFLYNTPNRGLLLYHGLGVGKTCAAIIPSQMYFFNKIPLLRKHTIIICPASLESEWIQEIQTKCGCENDEINLKDPNYLYRYYTFIRLTGFSGTGFRKVNYDIELKAEILEKCIDHPNKIYLGDKVQFFYASKMFSGIIIDILDGTFNKNTYNATKFKVYFIYNEDKKLNITLDEVEYEFDKIITINKIFTDDKKYIKTENKITEIYCKIDKINRKYNNAFDNKFVIIDEAHNFTSFLNKHYSPNKTVQNNYNPDKKAKCISYEKLCSAINCKILLLTGTPIEHDIAEIPYLINILHGYIQLFIISFELKNINISKSQQLDIKIKNKLLSLNYINYFDIIRKGNTIIIKFTTIPPSYINDNRNDLTDITFSHFFKKNNEEIFKLEQDYDESKTFIFNNNNIITYTQNEIDNLLKTMNISTTNIWLKSTIFDESKKNSILPVNYKEVNNQKILNFDIPFLVKDDNDHPIAIKNKEYLTNSFQGKISYDAGVGSEQGIKKIDCKINLYFETTSTEQFQSYKASRDKEKKDKNPLRTQSQNDCLLVLKEEVISDKSKDDILKEYIYKKNQESKNYNIKHPNKKQKELISLDKIDKNKITEDYYIRRFILLLYKYKTNLEKFEFLNRFSLKYENLIRILENNYDIIQTYLKNTQTYDLSNIEDYTFNSITYPTGKVLIYSSYRKKGITAISHILETFGYKSLNEIILEHYNNFKTFFHKKRNEIKEPDYKKYSYETFNIDDNTPLYDRNEKPPTWKNENSIPTIEKTYLIWQLIKDEFKEPTNENPKGGKYYDYSYKCYYNWIPDKRINQYVYYENNSEKITQLEDELQKHEEEFQKNGANFNQEEQEEWNTKKIELENNKFNASLPYIEEYNLSYNTEDCNEIGKRIFNQDFNDKITNYQGIETSIFNNIKNNSGKDGKEATLGKYCRIIFISKSGSEGLSLHGIRQVHIMNSYWFKTLEEQVIGRAIRIGSHNIFDNTFYDSQDINKFKKVFVYRYLIRLHTSNHYSSDMLSLFNPQGDNGITTDIHINDKSEKIHNVVKDIYNEFKKHSVNCIFGDENMECNNTINIEYNKFLKYALLLKKNIKELNYQLKNETNQITKNTIQQNIQEIYNKYSIINRKFKQYYYYSINDNSSGFNVTNNIIYRSNIKKAQLIKFPINVPDEQEPIYEPFIIYKDTTTKIDNIDQQNKTILNNYYIYDYYKYDKHKNLIKIGEIIPNLQYLQQNKFQLQNQLQNELNIWKSQDESEQIKKYKNNIIRLKKEIEILESKLELFSKQNNPEISLTEDEETILETLDKYIFVLQQDYYTYNDKINPYTKGIYRKIFAKDNSNILITNFTPEDIITDEISNNNWIQINDINKEYFEFTNYFKNNNTPYYLKNHNNINNRIYFDNNILKTHEKKEIFYIDENFNNKIYYGRILDYDSENQCFNCGYYDEKYIIEKRIYINKIIQSEISHSQLSSISVQPSTIIKGGNIIDSDLYSKTTDYYSQTSDYYHTQIYGGSETQEKVDEDLEQEEKTQEQKDEDASLLNEIYSTYLKNTPEEDTPEEDSSEEDTPKQDTLEEDTLEEDTPKDKEKDNYLDLTKIKSLSGTIITIDSNVSNDLGNNLLIYIKEDIKKYINKEIININNCNTKSHIKDYLYTNHSITNLNKEQIPKVFIKTHYTEKIIEDIIKDLNNDQNQRINYIFTQQLQNYHKNKTLLSYENTDLLTEEQYNVQFSKFLKDENDNIEDNLLFVEKEFKNLINSYYNIIIFIIFNLYEIIKNISKPQDQEFIKYIIGFISKNNNIKILLSSSNMEEQINIFIENYLYDNIYSIKDNIGILIETFEKQEKYKPILKPNSMLLKYIENLLSDDEQSVELNKIDFNVSKDELYNSLGIQDIDKKDLSKDTWFSKVLQEINIWFKNDEKVDTPNESSASDIEEDDEEDEDDDEEEDF
jgi:hypothetical protein